MTDVFASFKRDGDTGPGTAVQFNPASLRITLTNQFGEDPPEQHARATTAKLDVELIFDTTDDGTDVRQKTQLLHDLTIATGTAAQSGSSSPATGAGAGAAQGAASGGGSGSSGGQNQANYSLPKIVFSWGSMSHAGVIESLTETLDFWSSDGVPLRATVQVSIKGSGGAPPTYAQKAGRYTSNELPPPVSITPVSAPSAGTGATGAAGAGGDSRAGRFLAALNGLENMRAPLGAQMGAAASVNLSAAAGFSMSAGAGASAGFGAGASAGLGASASAGFAAGAGAGASAAAGLSASAGVGMSAGAGFGASAGAGFSASAGAGFAASAGAGFGASVGASFGASAGVGFGASAGAAFGASASGAGFSTSTSVTGIDGTTRTQSSTTTVDANGMQTRSTISVSSGGASAGIAAAEGAFAGLGASKTSLPSGSFDPNRLLPPPRPAAGVGASFDETGRVVSGSGQVAASWSAGGGAGVTFL